MAVTITLDPDVHMKAIQTLLRYSINEPDPAMFKQLAPFISETPSLRYAEEYTSVDTDTLMIGEIVYCNNAEMLEAALATGRFDTHEEFVDAYSRCCNTEMAEILFRHYGKVPNINRVHGCIAAIKEKSGWEWYYDLSIWFVEHWPTEKLTIPEIRGNITTILMMIYAMHEFERGDLKQKIIDRLSEIPHHHGRLYESMPKTSMVALKGIAELLHITIEYF